MPVVVNCNAGGRLRYGYALSVKRIACKVTLVVASVLFPHMWHMADSLAQSIGGILLIVNGRLSKCVQCANKGYCNVCCAAAGMTSDYCDGLPEMHPAPIIICLMYGRRQIIHRFISKIRFCRCRFMDNSQDTLG